MSFTHPLLALSEEYEKPRYQMYINFHIGYIASATVPYKII